MSPTGMVRVAAACLLLTSAAGAQTVRLEAPPRAEAGRAFEVTLTVLVEQGGGSATSPTLVVPHGVTATGPRVSGRHEMRVEQGRVSQWRGLEAAWAVTAARPGTYTVGPASAVIDGRRVEARAVTVEVLPPGTLPPPRRSPFDLFDPFSDPFDGFPFGSRPAPPEPEAPPPEYEVDAPRDRLAFVKLSLEPSRLVLGQQAVLRVIAYGARGAFRATLQREPGRTDFLSVPIDDDGVPDRPVRLTLGGETWHAAKLQELAVFPLRTGQLTVRSAEVTFEGRGYSQRGGLTRESASATVTVTEPPERDRPSGYRPGDVGEFRLAAEVSPREVYAGGAVSLVARLDGRGAFPPTLRLPSIRGVTFSEPTIADRRDISGGKVGGMRSFTYVVRFAEPGSVDLGALELPHWNPEKERYEIARAALGRVDVSPALAGSAPAPVTDEPPVLLPVRHDLPSAPLAGRSPADHPLFPWALLGGPGFAVALLGLRVGARRWRGGPGARRREAVRQRADLLAAARRSEGAEQARAVERALHLVLEQATGVATRGALLEELASTLARAGVSPEVASRAVDLLRSCEAVRFLGEQSHGDLLAELERLSTALPPRTATSSTSGVARGALAVSLTVSLAAGARAAAAETPATVEGAIASLERNAPDDALAALESLSDRGLRSPSASYHRAAAYLARAASPSARQGDRGQAAAALEEFLVQMPDDQLARQTLESLRERCLSELGRRGRAPVLPRPTLLRAVVGLARESTWAWSALAGSVLLTATLLGLLATGGAAHAKGTRGVGGALLGTLGALLLAAAGAATYATREYRATSTPAIVVAPEARLLDERGIPGGGEHDWLPETAAVHVLEQRGDLVRIERGPPAWLRRSELRLLEAR